MVESPGDEAGRRWMRRALELAERGRGRTRPNPMVGAVLVRDGEVVGEGFHERAGAPHAEVRALGAAGDRARGSTLYVTLEPCRHWGRTPPCTRALIRAGVRRVVAAMEDPDPRVAGQGLAELRAAGVEVAVGLMGEEARRLNEAYLTHRRLGRPFVTMKYAMTLDGRIATAARDSRWVSGEAARRRVHELRAQVDLVAVGVETVLADDPLLTVRLAEEGPEGRPNPIRLVLDSRARTPLESRLLGTAAEAPVWIATTRHAPAERLEALRAAGAEILLLPDRDGRVDLRALFAELGRRGLLHVLLEGGATIHGAALAARVVDRLMVFVAPRIAGGSAALGPVGDPGVRRMAEALRLRPVACEPVGEDWLIVAEPLGEPPGDGTAEGGEPVCSQD
ncbi:MAG: bifunctional diaminohydroxyphosphoribosylaminopyrimidine deaminase/5-amino-6-(5-phosphoribosylamino)uracil reductase RibD [Bacillota bacterium]|nr:bifunctional diaminohydroxyphosphoribosylaminopyrimidine deaminase/5-amino-6-(5-phosphoribosylamino)uracil reductase RibD [Bacillota bacterium]